VKELMATVTLLRLQYYWHVAHGGAECWLCWKVLWRVNDASGRL